MVRVSAILLCVTALPGAGFAQPKSAAKPPEALLKAWKSFENILPQLLSVLLSSGSCSPCWIPKPSPA